MQPISYARHQFPAAIIQHAVWLYLRFTLSYRDVEDLLAERGLGVSYETVRRWVGKFGPAIARNLRQLRCKPSSRWHLDEMVVRIAGKQMYLWRAVDDEGEVLEVLIQRRRNKAARPQAHPQAAQEARLRSDPDRCRAGQLGCRTATLAAVAAGSAQQAGKRAPAILAGTAC